MKHVTLLWLLLLGGLAPLRAQSPAPDSLRQHLDFLVAPLDKTQLPAPFLEEYGRRLLPLDVFNGTLTDSSRTNLQAFRLAYATLLTSHLTGTHTLPSLATVNARLRTQQAANPAIPVLVQRLDYAALRPDALTAGLLTAQGGQLHDVPGRTQSPYLPRTLFLAAPATSVAPTGDVRFIFTQGLHLQSGGGSLRTLSLDFGDGRGYLPVTFGQPIEASYCAAGTYRVKVRASYALPGIYTPFSTGGPAKQGQAQAQPPAVNSFSHFDLVVQEPGCAPHARYADVIPEEIISPTSEHAGGKIFIRYGSTNRTQLTRPLIVAEGYDVHAVAPDVQKENYDIEDFLRSINPFSGFSLYNALESASGPGGVNGYDIVFIDYNDGTDDIRRNAALFADVVRWVNGRKVGGTATGQQNVVLGISMGGLVARYGLADMVKNPNIVNGLNQNETHTRLLITHDSPHRGANTPLGLQALIRQATATNLAQLAAGSNGLYGTDIFPELEQADRLLDAPATRQLLLVRALRHGTADQATFGTIYNTFINNEYQPKVAPDAAYPFPYEFVATSLGSQCGTASLTPYDELVRYNFSGFISPMPWIRRTSYKTEIVVNALPNPGRVERISGLRVYAEIRTLGFINTRFYISNFAFHSRATNPVAWDGLPGGARAVKDLVPFIPPTPNGRFLWFSEVSSNFYAAGDFCFVPTASALDVPLDNATTRASYVNNLTTSPTPPAAARFVAQERFFSASGQKYNYPHPFFPGRQAQWIFNELQRPFNNNTNSVCDNLTECNPYPSISILGPEGFCSGGTATYRVTPVLPGVSVQWSVSPAGVVTPLSGNGPSITVSTGGAPLTSDFTLTATLRSANGCLLRTVDLGVSPMPAELVLDYQNPSSGRPFQTVCPYESIEFSLFSLNYDPTTVQWFAGPQGAETYRPSSWGVSLDGKRQAIFDVGNAGNFSVYATALDYCANTVAASPRLVLTVDPACVGVRPALATATLYPNPARETVDVRVDNATAAQPIVVRLFDSQGQARAEQTSTGQPAVRLSTGQLPAGLYFVHILRGRQVLSRQQLRIEK